MKRRNFIKMGTSLWALAPLAHLGFPINAMAFTKEDILSSAADPLQVLKDIQFASLDFNGDNINMPHEVLWNVDGFVAKKGGWPKVISGHVPNIVVGGGMAGLLGQYFVTKTRASLLLEQDPILGGNSKGEVYRKTAYSIGAAYVTVPDDGDDIDTFFKETGLRDQFRHEADTDVAVFFKNKITHQFWDAKTAPEAKAQFEKINRVFVDILENSYPDIPATADSAMSRGDLNSLDNISALDWLGQTLGEKPHAHIMEYFQLYGWSSFCGSLEELSAAQFLNFVTSETSGILALPGGNSRITSALYGRLRSNPLSSVRSNCFAIKIEEQADGKILVVYQNPDGELVAVTCDTCVVACPKYVAKKIVYNLPEDQFKAMDNITHRSYLVANILLNKKTPSAGYDLFNLKGAMPPSPSPMNQSDRIATDIVFADWADNDSSDDSILTVYRPLPFDGARQFLFNPIAHDKHRKLVLDDVNSLLSTMGLTQDNIVGVRMTRWGHSLPLSQKGWISSGAPEIVSRPLNNKVFFANQDNWVNPAFETAFAEAKRAAESVLGRPLRI